MCSKCLECVCAVVQLGFVRCGRLLMPQWESLLSNPEFQTPNLVCLEVALSTLQYVDGRCFADFHEFGSAER